MEWAWQDCKGAIRLLYVPVSRGGAEQTQRMSGTGPWKVVQGHAEQHRTMRPEAWTARVSRAAALNDPRYARLKRDLRRLISKTAPLVWCRRVARRLDYLPR